jgi:hypothetical protein
MSVTFIGVGFPISHDYSHEERSCWDSISRQIDKKFSDQQNLLISLTWFGPQFDNNEWNNLIELNTQGMVFDNLFVVATVDPPYLNITELQTVKNLSQALKVYYLGNFDSPHQFNFFAPIIAEKFTKYDEKDIVLRRLKYLYVNYNRKPKDHRVEFVNKLKETGVFDDGIVTLGKVNENDPYISIGEKHETYLELGNRPEVWNFGIPQDYYSLHNMDVWKHVFLYINGATEFNPINDLFCQQDTFKPMLGLRPFVINGVQRTYRWLRHHGFKTFNHYWSHIDIENGPVHDTIIDLIKYLKSLESTEILLMYQDMLPELRYNKDRFFEFAQEQKYRMENLFV